MRRALYSPLIILLTFGCRGAPDPATDAARSQGAADTSAVAGAAENPEEVERVCRETALVFEQRLGDRIQEARASGTEVDRAQVRSDVLGAAAREFDQADCTSLLDSIFPHRGR